MLFAHKKESYSWVGLEIGTQDVKLVHLIRKNIPVKWCVENIGQIVLPPSAVIDGIVKQIDAVQTAVSQLVLQTKTQKQDACIALPSSQVVSRQIKLPRDLTIEECEAELKQNIDYYFSEAGESCIDYVKLNSSDSENHEFFVVAARYEQIKRYVRLANRAGLRVKIVDVDNYAMKRAQTLLKNSCHPFQSMQLASHLNLDTIHQMASHFWVCCGLAMREISHG